MSIKEALEKLDPTDDSQWTADGAPLVDLVSKLHGKVLTRKEITDEAPNFNRESWAKTLTDLSEAGFSEPSSEEAVDQTATEEAVADESDEAAEEVATIETVTLSVDEALALTSQDFIDQPALCELAIGVFDAQAAALKEGVKKLQEQIEVLLNRSASLQDFQRKLMPPQNAIKDYIAGQNKIREQKAARTEAFLANGTNAADLKNALTTKSPIDAALGNRKPEPGTTRPARMPDRTQQG